MNELTLKERIDKVLDKRDEFAALRDKLTPFIGDTEWSKLVCFIDLDELRYYAEELGQVIEFDAMKWNDDENYKGEHYFIYRNVKFFVLVYR